MKKDSGNKEENSEMEFLVKVYTDERIQRIVRYSSTTLCGVPCTEVSVESHVKSLVPGYEKNLEVETRDKKDEERAEGEMEIAENGMGSPLF